MPRTLEGDEEVGKERMKGRKRSMMVKKACVHCRHAKKGCEEQRPCKRCVQKKLQCSDAETTSPPSVSPTIPLSSTTNTNSSSVPCDSVVSTPFPFELDPVVAFHDLPPPLFQASAYYDLLPTTAFPPSTFPPSFHPVLPYLPQPFPPSVTPLLPLRPSPHSPPPPPPPPATIVPSPIVNEIVASDTVDQPVSANKQGQCCSRACGCAPAPPDFNDFKMVVDMLHDSNNASIACSLWDLTQEKLIGCNHPFQQLIGFEMDELKNFKCSQVTSDPHVDTSCNFCSLLLNVTDNRPVTTKAAMRCKDGRVICVFLHIVIDINQKLAFIKHFPTPHCDNGWSYGDFVMFPTPTEECRIFMCPQTTS